MRLIAISIFLGTALCVAGCTKKRNGTGPPKGGDMTGGEKTPGDMTGGDMTPDGMTSGDMTPTPMTPTRSLPGGYTKLPTDTSSHACQKDADCIRTCTVNGRCCGQLCGCTNVYARTFYAKIQEAHRKHCKRGSFTCPVAGCTAPTVQHVAKCTAGRCVLGIKVAKGRHPPVTVTTTSQSCKTKADCATSTMINGSCCGQRCGFAHYVYSKKFLAELATARKPYCKPGTYKCQHPKCARPAHNVEADCVRGQCTAKRVAWP